MYRLRLFILSGILFCLKSVSTAQNISGIINSYAAVTNIAGTSISVGSAAGFGAGDRILVIQMKGTSIVTTNGPTFGDISLAGGAGTYEFKDVSSVSGNTITISSSLSNAYNFATGSVQLVRVPKYCVPVITSTVTCPPWSTLTGTGGIIALEAGTLTLNSEIDANAMGFRGGNFATSGFCCNNGNYSGAAGGSGGQKGESVSAYIAGQDGLKGKQANGGGGSNCGNSGGGGGGNGGAGGLGGNQYSGCGVFDDRGVGGLGLAPSLTTMFMGGGGGGGFRDNGQSCTPGGNGGGIIYIRANVIISNTRTITACGGSVTTIINDEGAGGGGGGGTVFLACNTFIGSLSVKADGGFGGSNFNTIFGTNCHGPGGGGGGGVVAFSPSTLPGAMSISVLGGAAGTVNNPSSTCFNTTFGAAPGTNGVSLPNLPGSPQAFNVPTLSISQSNTICAGQTTTLSASGASSYSWNTGSTISFISTAPATNSVYTLIGYNGTCSTSASYTLQVTPGPTLSVAGTSSICSGQTASITVNSNATNYSWSTGSTSNSIAVSPLLSTAYAVTVSASGCSTTATHNLTVTITPTVSISGSFSVCNGQAVSLGAASASSYSWNTGATTAAITVTPSSTTSYSVVGANGSCRDTATHFINVIPVPTLNVTGATTLCAGTSVTISASGASSYSWSTGSTSNSISAGPSIPGNSFFNVTGTTNGCSSSFTHTLNVIPMPTVSIFGNSNLCSGQSLTLSAFYAYNYTWNTGATASLIVVSPSSSTTYSVLGANGACTVAATKAISVTPSPIVTASASSPSVCSGGSVQLTAAGANTYQWSTGSTASLITVSPFVTSTYSLYGTSNNCTSIDIVTVNVVPTPTLVSGNYSLCLGTGGVNMVAGGATSYSWTPALFLNATSGSVVVANPPNTTTYTLTGFNSNCSSSVQVIVQTYTTPQVSIHASADYVCKGNAVNLWGSGANSYVWQPAQIGGNTSSSVIVIPSSTSVYTLLGYGGNHCAGVATKTITVLLTPETYISPEAYIICEGSSIELHASGAEGYAWSPNTGLSSNSQSVVTASPHSTQTYTITGYNGVWPQACSSDIYVTVNVQPYAVLSIKAPDSICYGQRVNIIASGAKNYTWTPGTFLSNSLIANPFITPRDPITYTITGTATNFCPGTRTLDVAIKPRPTAYAGRDTILNFDQSMMLKGEGEGWLYTWKGSDLSGLHCINCPETYIHPQNSTCYILEVENAYGCTASDEVCIEVTHDHGIYIPNSFSPNGDGVNDLFTPLGFGVVSFELLIFNRWGERLFSGKGSFTEGRLVSWDGNYKGVKCKSDGYVYKFIYTLPGSKTLSRQGEIILLGPKD